MEGPVFSLTFNCSRNGAEPRSLPGGLESSGRRPRLPASPDRPCRSAMLVAVPAGSLVTSSRSPLSSPNCTTSSPPCKDRLASRGDSDIGGSQLRRPPHVTHRGRGWDRVALQLARPNAVPRTALRAHLRGRPCSGADFLCAPPSRSTGMSHREKPPCHTPGLSSQGPLCTNAARTLHTRRMSRLGPVLGLGPGSQPLCPCSDSCLLQSWPHLPPRWPQAAQPRPGRLQPSPSLAVTVTQPGLQGRCWSCRAVTSAHREWSKRGNGETTIFISLRGAFLKHRPAAGGRGNNGTSRPGRACGQRGGHCSSPVPTTPAPASGWLRLGAVHTQQRPARDWGGRRCPPSSAFKTQ